MPSTLSPNKLYEEQATNENDGTWGVLLNAVLTIIDLNLGGRLSKTINSSDVVLTDVEARNLIINLDGVLTGNRSLEFPATNGGIWVINNGTSGAFTVTAKPTGGTGVVIPQGSTAIIVIDPGNTIARLVATPNVMTTQGDLVTRDASGVKRLARGTAGQYLGSNGTEPVWSTFTAGQNWGLIYGLQTTPSLSSNIQVGAGYAADSASGIVMTLASDMNKLLAQPWSSGSGGGARDTGTLTDGWWNIHLIQRSDTGNVDVLASLSSTAPSLPPGYDRFRRIWAVYVFGGVVRRYTQSGDYCEWTLPSAEVNDDNPLANSPHSLDVSAPEGRDFTAYIRVYMSDSQATLGTILLVNSIGQGNRAITGSNPDLFIYETDSGPATGEITRLVPMAGGGPSYKINRTGHHNVISMTIGYYDARGRNG